MGIQNWTIVHEMDPEEFEDSGVPGFMWLAEAYVKPEYEHAAIHFSVPSIARVSDYELKETVIHELGHVVVAEAKIKNHDREEHVVTMLARAFMRSCQN